MSERETKKKEISIKQKGWENNKEILNEMNFSTVSYEIISNKLLGLLP